MNSKTTWAWECETQRLLQISPFFWIVAIGFAVYANVVFSDCGHDKWWAFSLSLSLTSRTYPHNPDIHRQRCARQIAWTESVPPIWEYGRVLYAAVSHTLACKPPHQLACLPSFYDPKFIQTFLSFFYSGCFDLATGKVPNLGYLFAYLEIGFYCTPDRKVTLEKPAVCWTLFLSGWLKVVFR